MRPLRKMTTLALSLPAVLLSGCGLTPSPSPYLISVNAPMFSAPVLISDLPRDKCFDTTVWICNRGPGVLNTDVHVVSDQAEVADHVSNITVPMGMYAGLGICHIKRSRSHPIRLRLSWKREDRSGAQSFTILPTQGDWDRVKTK